MLLECTAAVLVVLISVLWLLRRSDGTNRTVVLVLGEFGRSPRMQYHAHSLSSLGPVDVVAYPGNAPHPVVRENKKISIHSLRPILVRYPRKLFLLVAPVKVLMQILQLFFTLLWLPRPNRILVQNPPAIPSLLVAVLVCRVRGCELAIDWHNFGYTILALNRPKTGPIVRFAEVYERILGRMADVNLCVTEAMRKWLADNWQIQATVLHDRPPRFVFHQPTVEVKCEVLRQVDELLGAPTFCDKEGRLVSDPPRLMVSSTSWTADEDFNILLEAAEALDRVAGLPKLVVVITGKGDLRDQFEQKAAQLKKDGKLRNIQLCCAWLKAEHYPVLLSCAQLGLSLHYSSSGLDLPMKVVDMYGAGIPVCQVRFDCVAELVTDGKTGLLFKDAAELTKQLAMLLAEGDNSQLKAMKKNVLAEMSDRDWVTNWNQNAKPLFS